MKKGICFFLNFLFVIFHSHFACLYVCFTIRVMHLFILFLFCSRITLTLEFVATYSHIESFSLILVFLKKCFNLPLMICFDF